MIPTSEEFKEAVYSPIRTTTAKVTFDISDVTAADDNTATVTSEAVISRKDQLTNQKWVRPAYATFEPDYWKLDGSFQLPPVNNETGNEVGWYSGELSDSFGNFATPQTINFAFSSDHSSMGLTINFDLPANEYAADFDITVYSAAGSVIRNVLVQANDKARYVIEDQFFQYRRILITIRKWCKPYRRAKIVEVSFGVVREYDDDKLIELSIVEELNMFANNIPANEIEFTVDNSSREFNILNPNGFYKFLQERQTVVVEIGVQLPADRFEFVNMGTYFLTDWQSDEGALTTTFTARNRIDLIPDTEVENETGAATNLYALAVSVIQQIGIKSYYIDPALQSISTQGAYRKMTYRKLLQFIAIAGQCVFFVDREDRLHIRRLATAAAVDSITFDNIYREPKISLDKLISRVEVAIYTGVNITSSHVLTSPISGGGTLKVENSLINSLAHAQAVAQWILDEANRRALYEVNWRQNPALEPGDMVTIEDVYGAQKVSRITAQEYEYRGYLGGKTKSKGGL